MPPSPAPVPIAEGLFTWPADEPQLLGSRCNDCSVVTFPSQASCPRCTGESMREERLARRGTLWTWTVQAFPPPAPPYLGAQSPFEPYGVGYVDLPGQVRVESRLTEADPARLRIGMAVELVVEPLARAEDGRELLTYAFRPVAGQ